MSTELYMGNLRSLFWFSVTIPSILSLSVLPLRNTGSEVSTAPLHNQINLFFIFLNLFKVDDKKNLQAVNSLQ